MSVTSRSLRPQLVTEAEFTHWAARNGRLQVLRREWGTIKARIIQILQSNPATRYNFVHVKLAIAIATCKEHGLRPSIAVVSIIEEGDLLSLQEVSDEISEYLDGLGLALNLCIKRVGGISAQPSVGHTFQVQNTTRRVSYAVNEEHHITSSPSAPPPSPLPQSPREAS